MAGIKIYTNLDLDFACCHQHWVDTMAIGHRTWNQPLFWQTLKPQKSDKYHHCHNHHCMNSHFCSSSDLGQTDNLVYELFLCLGTWHPLKAAVEMLWKVSLLVLLAKQA